MKLSRLPAALAAAVALWAAAPVALQAQVRLPALGESVSEDFSVSAEKRLGEQVMREIRRDPDYIDDPQLLDYLQTIWQPLVQAARDRGEITAEVDPFFAWESFLVRDRSVNAFALPGGYVGVHLGLIAMTSTRDELAAVLAHELSHVTQRHIARSMVNSSRQSLVGMIGIILGAIAAGRAGNADATQAVIVGGQAAMVQGQLNFSRDMEREADRVGYGVLSTAGFSPTGMTSMFEKLQTASRLNDSGGFPYLRSHPLTSERIGDARARASMAANREQSSPLRHTLMQARARVLMDPREPSLRRIESSDTVATNASPADRLAALYASALAATLLRDWSQADAALQKADAMIATNPQSNPAAVRELQWLRMQSLTARGDGARALMLAQSVGDDGSRAGLLLRAQAATAAAAKNAQAAPALRQSVESLQTWASVHPHDAGAWQQLAQSAEQAGLPLRAVRAEAEARASVGDLGGAIDRLRAAQRMSRNASSGDFIDASIIDARLRNLEAQRRELQAELRAERRGSRDDQ
jgi:predicted Zn-dependent protease